MEENNLICECGHDWNFHNVLSDEQCHEMNCNCNKYNPSLQPAKRVKCPQCQAYAEYDSNKNIICNNAHCKINEDREVIPLYSLRGTDEPPKILKDKIKKSNDNYYQKNKDKLNERRRLQYQIDDHYKLVVKTKDIVSKAIKEGKLERPMYCNHCKKFSQRIEAHHEDYSKPLEIKWLCRKCHSRVHKGVINLGDSK